MRIQRVHSITASEFAALAHTELYATMLRNRIAVCVELDADQRAQFCAELSEHLAQLVTDCYHVCDQGTHTQVYFASHQDLVTVGDYIANQ